MYALTKQIKEFVLGGNSTFTLRSGKTGRHFTYKINVCKTDDNLFFVKLLHGPDNTADYNYIGCYYKDSGYFHPAKAFQGTTTDFWPRSMQAIRYFLDNIDNVPKALEVFHEGKCCRCGRTLTTPESILLGIGPECLKTVGGQYGN